MTKRNQLFSGPFDMECTFTDAGMQPLRQTVTSFDQIFTLLVRLNQTYTRLTVMQKGRVVMTADRQVGDATWKSQFISDLYEIQKPKFQSGQEVYHAATDQWALVTEIRHDLNGPGLHHYYVEYTINGLRDSLPESELVSMDKMRTIGA